MVAHCGVAGGQSTLTFAALLPGGLDELFRHLPGRPWHRPGGRAPYEELRKLVDGVEVRTVAERVDARVRAIGVSPEGTRRHVAVRSAAVFDRRREEGFSIFVDDLGGLSAGFRALERSTEDTLGVPPGACQAKASISPPGVGVALHFDQYEGFQFQLSGSKEWQLAENDQAPFALHPYMAGLVEPPELEQYTSGPLTEPKQTRRVRLEEGDFLFVPRGLWHSTRAGAEESVSIFIRCGPPAWLELLPAELRERLIREPRWREPAYGAWGNGAQAETDAPARNAARGVATGTRSRRGPTDSGSASRRATNERAFPDRDPHQCREPTAF